MVAGMRRPSTSSVAVALGEGEGLTDGLGEGEASVGEALGDAADADGADASPSEVHPARSRASTGIRRRGRRTAASLRVLIDGACYQSRSSAS
jgi:hypothetical protein